MVVLALVSALVAACLELAYGTFQVTVQGRFLFAGQERFWLTPAGYLVLMGGGGAVLALVDAWWPATRRWSIAVIYFVAAFAIAFLFHPALHLVAAALLSAGVAWRLSGPTAEAFDGLTRRLRPAVALGIAIVALASLLTREPSGETPAAVAGAPAADPPPNVLLLILDTVRGSELSLLGHWRRTSPRIDAFASTGLTFEAAISPAPWTLPSHASIFTGIAPHALEANWEHPLERTPPTLASHFHEAGYRTAGFAGNNAYVSRETGLDRGFGHFEDYVPQWTGLITDNSLGRFFANNPRLRRALGYHDILGRRTAGALNASLLRWLDREGQGPGGRPFFAMVNYYDAHEPYLPHAPFDTLFGSTAGRDVDAIRQINARLAERAGKTEMDSTQRQLERLAYDQSIAELDAAIGALVDSLKGRGMLANTIVAITADHGEQFGERGLYSHGNGLYAPSLHVPLVIVAPGRISSGGRRADVISTQDLGATLLSLAGVRAEAPFPGRSLLDTTNGPRVALSSIRPARNQSPSYPSYHGEMYSALADSVQLISSPKGEELLRWREAEHRLQGTTTKADSTLLPALRTLVEGARRSDRVPSPNAKAAGASR